ncbi:hypothetical protein HYR69_11950 [Candidatus Sumerlaeota bacterium]|nr:hypothetical protein [Candidatus Sumerlaeota bacterium]
MNPYESFGGGMRRDIALIAVLLSLTVSSARCNPIEIEGYQTDQTFSADTEKSFSLRADDSAGVNLYVTPHSPAPSWTRNINAPGSILRSFYTLNSLLPERSNYESAALVIDLISSDTTVKVEDLTPDVVSTKLGKLTFRISLDANGDKIIDESETQDVPCSEISSNPFADSPGSNARIQLFPAGVTGPDGKSVELATSVELNLRPGMVDSRGNRFGYQVTIRPSVQLRMPLQAPVKIAPRPLFIKLAGQMDWKLTLTGYSLWKATNDGFNDGPPRQFSLSEPLFLDGKWWIITKIPSDLSSISLAEPAAGFVPPLRARVGDQAPDFARVDIVSRKLIQRSDFDGGFLILQYRNSMVPQQYSTYRILSDRIRSDLGGNVALIFVENSVNYDQFFQETAGLQDLAFALVKNQAMNQQYGSGKDLTDILWMSPRDFAQIFLIGPGGKILIREADTLDNTISRIIQTIKDNNGIH